MFPDGFSLLRVSEGSTLRPLFAERLKFAAFIQRNEVPTNGSIVAAATRRFAIRARAKENVAIVDAQDVRN